MSLKKRPLIISFAMILLIFPMLIYSCANDDKVKKQSEDRSSGFSITFIDIGHGDSTLITLPDDTIVLIDCGNTTTQTSEKVVNFLKEKGISKIDYFILSNPLPCQIGNAEAIIDNFSVGLVYIPQIIHKEQFPLFYQTYNKIVEKSIQTRVSYIYESVIGSNYSMVFLLPEDELSPKSPYLNINTKAILTQDDLEGVSPIIYFKYKDYSFLLNSDTDTVMENLMIDYYVSGLYRDVELHSGKIELEHIDLLKCASHGDNDATSTRLLEMLDPKNVVISVGGDNNDNLPKSSVLTDILAVNENCNIYRTDVNGDIEVKEIDGELVINTKYHKN